MISEESDSEGFLQGRLSCDGCHKTLYTYFSEQDAPPADRDYFLAFPVELRVVVKGTSDIGLLKKSGFSAAFEFDNAVAGYRVPANAKSHPLLDFCSLECAYQWFDRRTEYGLLCYGFLSRQVRFVKDNPDRFETEEISYSDDICLNKSEALYLAATTKNVPLTKRLLGSKSPYYLFELYFDRYPFSELFTSS
jgi:hypothetical protein